MITKIAENLRKNIQLQEHQKDFLKKLDATNAILAYHGLGSGKTLSSIAGSLGHPTDVVVPASLRENYSKEVSKFVTGKPGIRSVSSYEKAVKDAELPHSEKPNNTLIIDEVQRIGNSASKRSQVLRSLAPKYSKRILLSGTPAQNHPYELGPVIKMLDPDNQTIPLNPSEFNRKFLIEKTVKPTALQRLKGITPGTVTVPGNLNYIREAIKGRVHYQAPSTENFPKRIDQVHKVEMSPEQAKTYTVVTDRAAPNVARKVKANMPLAKQETKNLNAFITAARQVSNTPKAYGSSEILSPKLKKVVDNVLADPDKKHVIYSHYIDSGLEPVQKTLQNAGVPVKVFSGKLNDKEKRKAVNAFNQDKAKALLLSSAGAEGIDLKGTRNIHIVEPHWNKSKIDQVIGRGIRFKSHDHLPETERSVTVHKYHSVFPRTKFQKLLKKDPPTAADTYLDELSERKADLLSKFTDIFKQEGQATIK
jgi:SNF2 family DNA or RNA helicase